MDEEWDEGAWDTAVIAFSGRYAEEEARGGSSPWGWDEDWAVGEEVCHEAGIPVSDAQAEARRQVSANRGSIRSTARGL